VYYLLTALHVGTKAAYLISASSVGVIAILCAFVGRKPRTSERGHDNY
jgi:hypothetical protein